MRSTRFIVAAVAVAALAVAGGALAGGARHTAAPTTLVVVGETGIPTLDREAASAAAQLEVLENTFEPLVRFKPTTAKDKQGIAGSSYTQFTGGLCDSFGFSADKKHWTCKLGNYVSATGNEVTSADIAYSFKWMIAQKNLGLNNMTIAGVDVKNPVTTVNRKTFRINLAAPNSLFESLMTLIWLQPFDSVELKKHVTKKDPWGRLWLTNHSDGFGPYYVTSFEPNRETRLAANPNYKGRPSSLQPTPTIKQIVYRAAPDNGTRAQLLRTGAAQLSRDVGLSVYEQLKGSTTTKTYTFPYQGIIQLVFNTTTAPFDNVDVRTAVACAMDKQAIATKVYLGQNQVAHSIMSPKAIGATGAYDPCPTRNVAKAKSLLTKAGFTADKPLELPLTYSVGETGPSAEDVSVLLQQQLTEAGIKVTLTPEIDGGKFFGGAFGGQYPVALWLIGTQAPDPAFHYAVWYAGTSFLNFAKFKDPAADAAYHKMTLLPLGSPQRLALTKQIQKLIMEAEPYVPIVFQTNRYVVSKQLCGLRSDPGDFVHFEYLRFC